MPRDGAIIRAGCPEQSKGAPNVRQYSHEHGRAGVGRVVADTNDSSMRCADLVVMLQFSLALPIM